jgi:hypothetical protein
MYLFIFLCYIFIFIQKNIIYISVFVSHFFFKFTYRRIHNMIFISALLQIVSEAVIRDIDS